MNPLHRCAPRGGVGEWCRWSHSLGCGCSRWRRQTGECGVRSSARGGADVL